ncbi:MAG: ABC transporter ATP-binding protein/permease [Bacilli bacterium]|nr:ABC transporter ATP-binding protein/permease [Bacilli bacterium]
MKIIKNNLIMIKYVIKLCPLYVLVSILFILASSVSSLADVMIIERVTELIVKVDVVYGDIVYQIVLFVIVTTICLIITRLYYGYLVPRFRHQWVKKIQHIMFEKASRLDMQVFDNPKEYDLFNRALREGDIKGINTFDTFVRFLRSIFILLTLGTYLVYSDVFLLLIIFVQVVLTTIIQARIPKLWYRASKASETDYRKLGYYTRVFYLEKYTCDIKTTRVSDLLIDKHQETWKSIQKTYRPVEHKSFVYSAVEDIIYQVSRYYGGFFYLMSKVYNNPAFTIAKFSGSINAVLRFTNNIYGAIGNFVSLRENAMYIDDFLWLMNYKPQIELSGGKLVDLKHPVIKIENLSFKYPNQEDYALKNVNFSILPKEKIAIIGYNGAGKTTLIKLLLKFYNVDDGKIFMDNEDYLNLDERDIRSKYVSIFQNFQIYSVSVLENVLFRKRLSPNDDEIVWNALEKSGLADKIREQKDGLDTVLTKEFTNDGLSLSGGEKQKLAIARIFASSSPIIILDEPTSSLDPVSEYDINKKILELCIDKTVILISHRLSTVVDAKKIYMFDSGEIIEIGDHKSLMKQKGKYYEMFTTQAKMYLEK